MGTTGAGTCPNMRNSAKTFSRGRLHGRIQSRFRKRRHPPGFQPVRIWTMKIAAGSRQRPPTGPNKDKWREKKHVSGTMPSRGTRRRQFRNRQQDFRRPSIWITKIAAGSRQRLQIGDKDENRKEERPETKYSRKADKSRHYWRS